MSSHTYSFRLDQEASFRRVIRLKNDDKTPFNLTGCTFRGHVKKNTLSSTTAFSFVFNITSAVNGEVEMSLPRPFYNRPMRDVESFVYDVRMETSTGDVVILFGGVITLHPGVTK